MRLTSILAAALLSSVATLTLVGCNATPERVEKVDVSVLPADVKGMLVTDAEITDVYRETYDEGAIKYKLIYKLPDGTTQTIRVNAAQTTDPHGVFEDPIK